MGKRQPVRGTLPLRSLSAFVSLRLFLTPLRAINSTFGWHCILKLSAGESNAERVETLTPANQTDGVLASDVHILIQSDLLQGSSPLTELSFTSEGVMEWRKINEGIDKSNHRIGLPNVKRFNS